MAKTPKKTPEEKANAILDKVRPFIEMPGGNVHLAKIEDGIAYLTVSGACVNCELAELTYNKMIGSILMDDIPEIKKVQII